MSQLLITPKANADIAKCRTYLIEATDNTTLGNKAVATIIQYLELLENQPYLGRPYPQNNAYRELIIPFGKRGYLALYQYDDVDDIIYVMRLRHGLERGYNN